LLRAATLKPAGYRIVRLLRRSAANGGSHDSTDQAADYGSWSTADNGTDLESSLGTSFPAGQRPGQIDTVSDRRLNPLARRRRSHVDHVSGDRDPEEYLATDIGRKPDPSDPSRILVYVPGLKPAAAFLRIHVRCILALIGSKLAIPGADVNGLRRKGCPPAGCPSEASLILRHAAGKSGAVLGATPIPAGGQVRLGCFFLRDVLFPGILVMRRG
jgi:hypothetical protein